MVAVPLGPAQVDITGVRAGDLNAFGVSIVVGGEPIDITDYEIRATARVKQTDDDGVDAVIEVTDAPNGKLTIRWPGEDIRTWLAGTVKKAGVWDMQMANGTDPVTIAAGSFSAEMDVTR